MMTAKRVFVTADVEIAGVVGEGAGVLALVAVVGECRGTA